MIYKHIVTILLGIFTLTTLATAQSPRGKSFGFGIMLGEPTGLTAKIWTARDEALALHLGNSYMGRLRLGADYLWHFNAFNSRIVNMYAGPGAALGFGASSGWWYKDKKRYWYKEDDDIAFGARGVFGINIIPKNTPLEIFGEIGVMIGLYPIGRANAEGAIGIRFYP